MQMEERSSLIEEVSQLDKVLSDTRIAQQQQWYREQVLFENSRTHFNQQLNGLNATMEPLNISITWPDDIDILPSKDLLRKMQGTFQAWQKHVSGVRTETKSKLRELTKTLQELREQWDERFGTAEAAYRQLLEALDKEGVGFQALSERRKGIQERISILDDRDRELREDILPGIQALEAEREELLTKLQNNRNAITGKREKKAESLTAKLKHKIRLKVHSRAHIDGFERALQEIAKGSRLQGSDLKILAAACHPIAFVKRLLAKDFDSISTQSGLESSKLARMKDTIVERDRLVQLYTLQLTDVEDIIEVQLEVAHGNYRPLEELSHGQKCMVVLMVALAEGDFPLLVDQPEDALHAPSIEEGIVSTLRSGRGTRQCIFATRNANILVSADVEQIIALQADSQHGQVAGTGSLDRFDHRQLIIYHVEGGKEAFQRRKTMYTLEPSL